jgi:CMP/dCMP kinase
MQWNNAMIQKKSFPSTIAIDGPAASGKSSVGKKIADALNYTFLDTGVMYRAVTYAVIQNGIDVNNEKLVGDLAESISIEVKRSPAQNESGYEIYVNSQRVSEQLKSTIVNQLVSQVSRYERVRTAMTAQQKLIGKAGSIVMAGRDIGTVVLPDADIKIYLEASPQERARRRFEEENENGVNASYDEILRNVQMRDEIDSSRKIAPLKPASDAHIINTDGKDITKVAAEIMDLISK